MTAAWKQAVRDALVELGWNQSRLATEVGAARSVISAVLGEGQTASDAVPAVCEVLATALGRAFPMPVLGVNAEIAEVIDQLSPEDRLLVLSHARRLLK